MANRWGNNGTSGTLSSWVPKSLWTVTAAMKLKDTCSLEESYDQPRQHIKKQRHHFATKVHIVQSYGFSRGHVRMWELDHKEGWGPENLCFQTVVLEKTLVSPLNRKEVKPVNPKGNEPWIFMGRTDAEAEAPIFWPPDANSQLIGKDPGARKDPDAGKDWEQKEKRMTEDEIVGWHHRLSGHEFEQTLGGRAGQGSLVCCSPWVHKELDTTEQLNNGKV